MQPNLTPKQQRALYMLACGSPINLVAKQLKIRRQTIWRWRQLPEFNDAFQIVTEDMQRRLQMRVMKLAHVTIDVLEKTLLHSEEESAYYNPIDKAFKVIDRLHMASVLSPPRLENTSQAVKIPDKGCKNDEEMAEMRALLLRGLHTAQMEDENNHLME